MSFFDLFASVFSTITAGLVLIASGTSFSYPPAPLSPAPFLSFPATVGITLPQPAPLLPKSAAIDPPASTSVKTAVQPTVKHPISQPVKKPQSPAPLVPLKPEPVETVSETPTPTPQPPTALPSSSTDDANATVRNALVNILCVTAGSGPIRPISGSGIIIDSRGIILTNAHVAQFMLLSDYPTAGSIDCVIRAGSPARALYKAELLYFPTQWMNANAHKIISENPTGTGEHDFALLRIVGPSGANTLPSSFPQVPMSVTQELAALPVVLAAYPAGFFDGATIQTNLFIASARTTIGQVFTFEDGGGADLFSAGGTVLSQKGSSGGAVVRETDGALVGLISTATQGATTAERDLRAITVSHINKSIEENTGAGLAALLTGDSAQKARLFNLNVVPTLRRSLVDVLEQ